MGSGTASFEKGTRYEIFIGIKDKDSYKEDLSADDVKKMLTDVCTKTEIGFSLITQIGGYSHGKGYTTETSLRLILIGVDYEDALILGDWMKKKVNTDTILITKTEVEYAFV